jgi:uncharacterized phage protein (TIGR01671 family)
MKVEDIKFRGINNETGEFVYGWYTKLSEGIRRINCIICEDSDGVFERFYIHDPETIGQYIGKTDKNGEELYAGDIIKWVNGERYWEAVISSVANATTNTLYANETFHNIFTTDEKGEKYTYIRSDSRKGTRNDLEYLSEVEKIGNIHQNPNLLQK